MIGLFAELNVERLQELQRFAEFGRVSAGLLHDISSPLTAAILHLEQNDLHGSQNIRYARRSIRVLERYVKAAHQQLQQESNERSFRLKTELLETRYVVQPLARRQSVKLRFNLPPKSNPELQGDPVKFQRVAVNLITNAIEACDSGQSVTVSFKVRPGQVKLLVRDSGCGIPAEQLADLFEPFHSTKRGPGYRNLGLGLATVKRHVEEDLGGFIEVKSSPGSGTKFCVSLPLC